jgi:nucleoside-diphosphate kinase
LPTAMSSRYTLGAATALVLEGNNAANVVKRIVGGTEPATADSGTIRGDFALDSYYLCSCC